MINTFGTSNVSRKDVLKMARNYSCYFDGLKAIIIGARPFICPFEDLLNEIPKNSNILDLGCGSGFFLYAAAKSRKIASCTGLETSSGLVDLANGALSQAIETSHCNIILASSFEDWPDEQFDVVSLIDVIHHVSPTIQQQFLEEAMRRVKPGGKIIFKDIRSHETFFAWANRLHDLVLARQWIHYMPTEAVAMALKSKGFKLISRKSSTMFWYGHDSIVANKL